MIEIVTYPLPLPDGTTVLVTVHWEGRGVHHVDCPTYQELYALCVAHGHDPASWAYAHFGYQAKLPGSPPRIRGAARLWAIVLGHCRNPVKEAEVAAEAQWARENPGATRTSFGARTGD